MHYGEKKIKRKSSNNRTKSSKILIKKEEYIDDRMELSMKECITKKGISIQEFQKNHKYLQKRMIYKYLKSYTTEYKDITSYHINEVLNLINKKNNAQIDLPHKIKAIRKYDYIVLEKQKDGYALGDNSSEEFEINISLLNLNNEIKQFSIGNWGYL